MGVETIPLLHWKRKRGRVGASLYVAGHFASHFDEA
jgi:hypothetical protein